MPRLCYSNQVYKNRRPWWWWWCFRSPKSLRGRARVYRLADVQHTHRAQLLARAPGCQLSHLTRRKSLLAVCSLADLSLTSTHLTSTHRQLMLAIERLQSRLWWCRWAAMCSKPVVWAMDVYQWRCSVQNIGDGVRNLVLGRGEREGSPFSPRRSGVQFYKIFGWSAAFWCFLGLENVLLDTGRKHRSCLLWLQPTYYYYYY